MNNSVQTGIFGIVTGGIGTATSVLNIIMGYGQYALFVCSLIAAVMGCYLTYPKFKSEWERRGGWKSLNPFSK